MTPIEFRQAMAARGFVLESSGCWHGPFGITVPGTFNDLNTTSIADRGRDETIREVDLRLAAARGRNP